MKRIVEVILRFGFKQWHLITGVFPFGRRTQRVSTAGASEAVIRLQEVNIKKEGGMKRIVLVVLMAVMLTTPCLAQEIKPDGLFTVDNTIWEIVFMGGTMIGFADGTVYVCMQASCDPLLDPPVSYSNFLLLTFFEIPLEPQLSGVLIPIIGVGLARVCVDGICLPLMMRKLPGPWFPNL